MVTGESRVVLKSVDDRVVAGTVATDSAIGTSALWKQALSDAISAAKAELRAEFTEARTRKQVGRRK